MDSIFPHSCMVHGPVTFADAGRRCAPQTNDGLKRQHVDAETNGGGGQSDNVKAPHQQQEESPQNRIYQQLHSTGGAKAEKAPEKMSAETPA